MARYDLREVERRLVEPLLPAVGKGKRRENDRRIISGIFYVLRTGPPWARPAGALRPLHDGLQPLQSLGEERRAAAAVGRAGRTLAAVAAPDRQLYRSRPSACCRRKKGAKITPSAVLVAD